MGAKRRRHRGGCRCDDCLAKPGVVALQLDPLDEIERELQDLHTLDALAFYDPDEVTESCR